MKLVYSFDNYREYLRAYYLFQKERSPDFSHAHFAKKAGLKSANYLNLIIAGKRNLTVENIHRFGSAMRLSPPEFSYFETLVLSNQARQKEEQAFYKQRLRVLREGRPKRGVMADSESFVSAWYFPALSILLHGQPAPLDVNKVARRLGTTREEIEKGERELLRTGILKINQEGRYQVEWDHLVFRDRSGLHQVQKAYLKAQLKLSSRIFESRYDSGAKFHSHTFSVSNENFESYMADLNSFIASMIARADQEKPERVVQLNTQFFSYE